MGPHYLITAERARHSEAGVIGHDEQNVGRLFGRHDARRPPRFGLEGVVLDDAAERVRSFLPLARYSETTLTRRHLARTALRARSLAARVPRIDGRGRCAISAMRRLIWCRYTLEHTRDRS